MVSRLIRDFFLSPPHELDPPSTSTNNHQSFSRWLLFFGHLEIYPFCLFKFHQQKKQMVSIQKCIDYLLWKLSIFLLAPNMENSLTSSKRKISKRHTLRRQSSNGLSQNYLAITFYAEDELKMLALLGLIRKFNRVRLAMLQRYEEEGEEKMRKTNQGRDKNSIIVALEPTKKQIIQLNMATKLMETLNEQISSHLISTYKKQKARKSHNSSVLNLFPLTPSLEPTLNNSNVQTPKQASLLLLVPKPGKIAEHGKQNVNNLKKISQSHRLFWSDLSFFSRGSSPVKKVSDGERRQRLFMLKKREEMKFIRKITVDFNSKEAEFKALVEMMSLFLKNLNIANYYLKMTDQNPEKHQKITIYLQQLLKLFSQITQIFLQLSKTDKALALKQPQIKSPISEYDNLAPLLRQYFEQSNYTIKVMRHFSLSPVFAFFVMPFKELCSRLVFLFVEARYTLRYLEKEIQGIQGGRKSGSQLPKWQKAYRVKFLPKNTVY